MADSEFGTGTNAEKVNISLLFDTGCSNLQQHDHFYWYAVISYSLRQIQTVHLVLTVTAHILEYIKN